MKEHAIPMYLRHLPKNRNPQKIEINHTSTGPVFICTFSYILFRSVNKGCHSKYIAVPSNGRAAMDSLHFCFKKVTLYLY